MAATGEKRGETLFAPIGAPRKGSHEDVLRMRLQGKSARETGLSTGYASRYVQEISSNFTHRVLPRIQELRKQGYEPSVIADETGLPLDLIELALERFPT